MTDPDRIFPGTLPYYRDVGWAFYVTRGLAAEEAQRGITLEEWCRCVAADPALCLEEDYQQSNIDRGVMEVWRELGRAHWGGEAEYADRFHYMPAHITAVTALRLPSTLLSERFQRAAAAVGQYPSLARWREYVEGSGVLRLEERVSVSGEDSLLPGRAVTTARSGGTIRYMPACVWIYAGPDVGEVSRWAKCREIAHCLAAQTIFGHRIEWT